MPRRLTDTEIEELLRSDSLLRMATVDADGYPHVTPLWFWWDGQAIFATSKKGAPHLARLAANPRVGILIDWEGPERADGERPNRQFRAVADAQVGPDEAGSVTREITRKYLRGQGGPTRARQRVAQERIVVRLVPLGVVAIASI